MKLILLSGGSGKRLWPLSNDTRSKQFLPMLKGENNEMESMIQRVWRQLKSVNLDGKSVIATSKMQKEMIYKQIGKEINVITEPERRDTFPAIALAAAYLYTEQQVDLDENIVVLPVDPYVEKSFFEKIKNLARKLDESEADIALIGVKPSYPSTKYGYIVPIKNQNQMYNTLNVSHFVEKPRQEKAQDLIEEGALWNCGVFAFKLRYILGILEEKGYPKEFKALENIYSTMQKNSFDFEVLENANRIIVSEYDGFWKDLGTWNTLTEEMEYNKIGKGIISKDSFNTHFINELDIPITLNNVKNLVVAASPDGILISDKESSPNIKDLIEGFNNPPMYEERIWGWSKTLDYSKYEDGNEMVTKRICILENNNSSYHYHKFRDEVWTIVKGVGELVLDDQIIRIKAGDVIHLPAGKKHGVKAISELEFIEVQTGPGIDVQDINRITFEWEEVLARFRGSKSTLFS
ncbi:sugar phosphate nucleotidyltransferase [Terribacillus saccharophilus]|uniref:sugar phosphate nucleotidyltransferase n=1 Tax=Terribacillus saccharophilus TaxID=361277 RepID=UPI002DC18E75|nr:sugar phosphate nucleotidyltransferase [Terribacillus saccharophilus]